MQQVQCDLGRMLIISQLVPRRAEQMRMRDRKVIDFAFAKQKADLD